LTALLVVGILADASPVPEFRFIRRERVEDDSEECVEEE